MYKTKLQELCHRNRWALPIYAGMKDGSERNPRFKASVFVGGTSFDSINICKSLKEAYNEAAKLAFFQLSSEHELACEGRKIEQAVKGVSMNANASSFEDDSLNITAGIDAEEQNSDRIEEGPEIHLDSLDMEHDLEQKFKTKLQIYAQRNNLGFPLYYSTREGPPASHCFRTTVTLGADAFDSPGSHKSIKKAEDAAAQVALMALSIDAFKENDIRIYKNLLQEFAQSEGFFMSQYKTTIIGEAHDPTFSTTVEVEGETFHGNPSKSKKQAKLSAAKVAYKSFMWRKSCQMGDFSSSSSKNEILKLACCVNSLNHADLGVSHKSESQTSSELVARYEVKTEAGKEDVDKGSVFSESLRAKTRLKMKKAVSVASDSDSVQQIDNEKYMHIYKDEVLRHTPARNSNGFITMREIPKYACPTAKYEAQMEASEDEDEEAVPNRNITDKNKFKTKEIVPLSSHRDSSTVQMATDTKSYLVNNRIKVYTYIPDMDSTKGNVVLPIDDGKWVVVNLECPK